MIMIEKEKLEATTAISEMASYQFLEAQSAPIKPRKNMMEDKRS